MIKVLENKNIIICPKHKTITSMHYSYDWKEHQFSVEHYCMDCFIEDIIEELKKSE